MGGEKGSLLSQAYRIDDLVFPSKLFSTNSTHLGETILCSPSHALKPSHFGTSFQFTLACLKMGRSDMAEKALKLAEKELSKDRWPEYYDTRYGKFVGKQARLYQTWTVAGYLASKMLLENPRLASLLYWDEDYELLEMCVCALSKSGRKICSRGAARSQILV